MSSVYFCFNFVIRKAGKSTKTLKVTTTRWPLDGRVTPLQQQRKSRISKGEKKGFEWWFVEAAYLSWSVTCCCVFKAGICFSGMKLNLLDLFRLAVLAFLCSPMTRLLGRAWYLQQWLMVCPFHERVPEPSFVFLDRVSSHLFGCAASAPESFPALPASSSTTCRNKWNDNLDKRDKRKWAGQ